MTPGILRLGPLTASIDNDGRWLSSDINLNNYLNSVFLPIPTGAGSPWISAFFQATTFLSAVIIQEPVDDWPGIGGVR